MSYTLINNGTLINGNGGNPIENAAVLIKNNLIVAAGFEKSIKIPDAEVNTIDANGGYHTSGFHRYSCTPHDRGIWKRRNFIHSTFIVFLQCCGAYAEDT